MMPIEVFRFIEQTLHDLVKNRHGALLSVSFVMGVYLASNSIDAIMAGFSSSSNITKWHSPFKQRLLSLGLLVALAVLMMVGIPLLTLSGIAIRTINEYGYISGPLQVYALFAVKWVISILIVITSVSLPYKCRGIPATSGSGSSLRERSWRSSSSSSSRKRSPSSSATSPTTTRSTAPSAPSWPCSFGST
ncbi:MAG: YihY/virulence factor BrkB family protein [Flavobacteriales bacterium]|nr:YihY/virulence factor BrkB family protein [Flavobacteriales bacterium]